MAWWGFFCNGCDEIAEDVRGDESARPAAITTMDEKEISPRRVPPLTAVIQAADAKDFADCSTSDGCGSDAGQAEAAQVKQFTRQTSMADRISTLQAIELFSRFSEEELLLLSESFTSALYQAWDVVIQEGDCGTDFFIITAGKAQVTVADDSTFTVELSQGHWFGEKALLNDMPRMASVTAVTPLRVIKLHRDKFRELGLNDQVFAPARKGILGGKIEPEASEYEQATPLEPDMKTFCVEATKCNKNLSSLVDSLSDELLEQLVGTASLQVVKSGVALIEQGSTNTDHDCYYIIKSGRFAIFQQESAGMEASRKSTCCLAEMASTHGMRDGSQESERAVTTLTRGQSFGELALLYAAPRKATVQALEDSEVFCIGRTALMQIIHDGAKRQLEIKAGHLRNVALFESLTEDELRDLAGVMQEAQFHEGDLIMQQGDQGDTFYVMVEGRVGVFKDNKLQAELSASKAEGTSRCFGERSLLQQEPRAATIKVLSDCVQALACDRESFKFLLSGLFEVLTTGKRAAKGGKRVDFQEMVQKRMAHFGLLKRKELKKLGVLGFGSLGVVELREHIQTKKLYALKMMSKGYIFKSGLQKTIQHTRDVLIVLNSPFIIKLVEAYNSAQALYFVMETCFGGDLLAVYTRRGLYGAVGPCKYYIASMMMALEHMHKFKIVYRDTKAENLLIDNAGTLKLVDMDCAKFAPGKTYTVCGTPEYLAPEVTSLQGHSFPCDWWGVGILTFELLASYTPFVADAPLLIYKRVAAGIDKVKFPIQIKPPAKDFIKTLLVDSPSDRVLAKPNGMQIVKKMVFWQGVDWTGIRSQTATPPHVPKVSQRIKEAKNFHPRPEDMPPQIVYEDDGSGWDANFATST